MTDTGTAKDIIADYLEQANARGCRFNGTDDRAVIEAMADELMDKLEDAGYSFVKVKLVNILE